MYQPHEVFEQPQDLNVKVWRYMDFTKLVSLLDSRRLFFTRADKFEDPYEGTWPKQTLELVRRMALERSSAPDDERTPEQRATALVKFFQDVRKFYAVSCWHMNNHESAAMWKLYLKSDEGIAIQSTYSRFRSSFDDDNEVLVGAVKYIDYETDIIPDDNVLASIVHKRKSFEHEREVRAAIFRFPDDDETMQTETIGAGIKVRVNLETLIENIYVAPDAPIWLVELVQAVLNVYRYNFPVIHSKLYAPQLY